MDGAKNNGEKDEKTPRSYTEQLFKGIKGVETSVKKTDPLKVI